MLHSVHFSHITNKVQGGVKIHIHNDFAAFSVTPEFCASLYAVTLSQNEEKMIHTMYDIYYTPNDIL